MNERILNFQSRDTIIKDTRVYKRVYKFGVWTPFMRCVYKIW